MEIEFGGLFGFIILVLVIWAVVETVQSGASTGAKVLWIVFLLLVPVLGLIVWFIAGPRKRAA